MHGAMKIDRLMRDEEGFTTAGMAVALLVSLTLLFSAAQVYRVNTRAAEIQDVADAAALAAENQVAEFMVAVRVVDGAVLSMTLLGAASYGLGTVALCMPPTAELGAQLISAGQKALNARDVLAERAASALDGLQRALPFMAAASAASVGRANGEGQDSAYYAVALLLPSEGAPITVGENGAEGALEQEVQEGQDGLAEAAARAEEAARAAEEAKERGFRRDCGDAPDYCMYERAQHLAGLEGAANPHYTSVDAWSFSVALERARAYYAARLRTEAPEGPSVDEKARSALRRMFYRYAVTVVRQACDGAGEGDEVVFPRLPRNTEQVRETTLYTDPSYPVTTDGELPVMHAWEGCPESGLVDYYGSLRTLEEGTFAECPACRFTASSLGAVAAASTAIENGFEYHYDAVARASEDYERARREAEPLAEAVREKAQSIFDQVLETVRGAASMRIEARPPGASGCLALVVSPGEESSARWGGSFVAGNGLGPRAAVAAATLIEDGDEGASVVGDLLDGLGGDGSAAIGAGRIVLDCWSSLLGAYGTGQAALIEGVERALDGLPLVGSSGLGSWAAGALGDGLAAVGLQPADIAPLKPVLVDSGAVASADSGPLSVRYLAVREEMLGSAPSSGNVFGSLADRIEREAFDRLNGLEIEIACIELPVVGLSLPLTVALPPVVTEGAQGLVERAMDVVRSAAATLGLDGSWE